MKYQQIHIRLKIEQHQALSEFARRENRSISNLAREMIVEGLTTYRHAELRAAAHALLGDYQSNPELTDSLN